MDLNGVESIYIWKLPSVCYINDGVTIKDFSCIGTYSNAGTLTVHYFSNALAEIENTS